MVLRWWLLWSSVGRTVDSGPPGWPENGESLLILLLARLIPEMNCLYFWDELSFEDEEFTLNPHSEIGYKVGEVSLEVKVFYLLTNFMNWEDKRFFESFNIL